MSEPLIGKVVFGPNRDAVETVKNLRGGRFNMGQRIAELSKENARLHRILNHIAEHGIQTDGVNARISMSEANMKRDLVTVLEEGMNRK